jgi:hypothetical protein
VILGLLEGEYNNPIRVVAFNTFEGWSQDVSSNIAQELRRRCDLQQRDVPSNIHDFVERHEGHDRQLLRRIADECERGVLFTADRISGRGLGGRTKPPPIPPSDAQS